MSVAISKQFKKLVGRARSRKSYVHEDTKEFGRFQLAFSLAIAQCQDEKVQDRMQAYVNKHGPCFTDGPFFATSVERLEDAFWEEDWAPAQKMLGEVGFLVCESARLRGADSQTSKED